MELLDPRTLVPIAATVIFLTVTGALWLARHEARLVLSSPAIRMMLTAFWLLALLQLISSIGAARWWPEAGDALTFIALAMRTAIAILMTTALLHYIRAMWRRWHSRERGR